MMKPLSWIRFHAQGFGTWNMTYTNIDLRDRTKTTLWNELDYSISGFI